MAGNFQFDQIYEEFRPKIRHYLSRLAGPVEAEDLTQEVFEKISSALEDFRRESKLSTWLYRIATNTALDRLRSSPLRQVSAHTPLQNDEAIQDRNLWTGQMKSSTEQEYVRKEMSECIRGYIEGLPPDYRAVIVLNELEGFKNTEIADILQIPLSTVKIRLHRARASLRKQLDRGCTFHRNEQNVLACDRKPLSKQSVKPQ